MYDIDNDVGIWSNFDKLNFDKLYIKFKIK